MLLVCATCCDAMGKEFVYTGVWKITNRPLEGQMTCVVTPVAKHEWQNDLHGTATIDGAVYEWRAWIKRDRFKANFTGDRHEGSFDLQRSPDRERLELKR